MRAALLCDVDQSVYHVGDEAIAAATAAALRQRGVDVELVSRREKYGPAGRATEASIPALTFPWPVPDRARYLAEIRRVLAGEKDALPAEDKLFEIIERMRAIDVLVIGGGGSLTSRFGWLLSERLATALVARACGARVVLSGQSLGPDLSAADAALVGELLDLCELVGVRDAESLALARRLRPHHPALFATVDDAIGLDLGDLPPRPARAVISVTVGADADAFPRREYARVIAAATDALARRTGAEVELVPHMADPDTGGHDLAVHARIAELMEEPARLCPLEDALTAARRTATSRYVLTTRFHPVVFGLLAGAGVLAIPLNRYGRSRMDGALGNASIRGGAVPFAALWDPITGGPSALLEPLIEEFAAGAGAAPAPAETLRARHTAWWDHVVAVLQRRAEPGAATAATPPADRELWSPAQQGRLAPYVAPRAGEAPRRPAGAARTQHDGDGSGDAAREPAVAIILRTKDRPLFLERAVQDVLGQSLADWRLVVVNDGGDRAEVERILAGHDAELAGRATVIHHERSRGMEAASNAGLAASGSEFVAIHDDDDTWSSTFLQQTLAHLRSHPEELGVAVGIEGVHEHLVGEEIAEDDRFRVWPAMRSIRLSDFLVRNRIVPISLLYRRSAHERVGAFREDLPVVGDYDFHLRLLQEGSIGFLDMPLAQWRLRPAADGSVANSFADDLAHRHYDELLREEQLRPWVREHGPGLPMFMVKAMRESAAEAQEAAALRDARLLATLDRLSDQLEDVQGRLAALEAADPLPVDALRIVHAVSHRGRSLVRRARRRLR